MPSPTPSESTAKKHSRKTKSIFHDYFKRRKIGETAVFAAFIGTCVAGYFFWVNFIFYNRLTFLKAITNSLIIFCIAFALIISAHVAGGRIVKGEININPWYAWFVAGSWLVFWIGASWVGRFYVGGFVAVGVWGIVLFCVWSINRLLKRKA